MLKNKKFVIVYAVVIFFIVFLISFNAVCSISQFEIEYEVSSMGAQAQNVQDALEEKYRGKSYLFLKREDVTEVVAEEGGGYLELTSFSKRFPNKICATVREKLEHYAFTVEDGGKTYYVAVGDDGKVLAVREENANNIGGTNVEIVGFEFAVPAVGDVFAVSEKDAAAYAALGEVVSVLESRLGGLRDNIVRIEYDDTYADYKLFAQFVIRTREGVEIRLFAPETNGAAKADAALDVYLQQVEGAYPDGTRRVLSDEERTYGTIVVVKDDGSAFYSPRSFIAEDFPALGGE